MVTNLGENHLIHKTHSVNIGNETSDTNDKCIYRGMPQGSTLGPLYLGFTLVRWLRKILQDAYEWGWYLTILIFQIGKYEIISIENKYRFRKYKQLFS